MSRNFAGCLVIAVTCVTALTLSHAMAQAPAPTILNGVYTEAQAMRGEAEYAANCAKCHEGECPEGPPLSTPLFVERWREENLGFLFGFMKTRMPAKAEGSLSESAYLDILAHILKRNEYPAGSAELTVANLDRVKFVGKDGPKPLPTNALVQVVGCFAKDPVEGWILNSATEAVRTLEGSQSTPQEITAARAKPRGSLKFELQDDRAGVKTESFSNHKVQVKGALIRQNTGTHRLIVTSLESLANSCR